MTDRNPYFRAYMSNRYVVRMAAATEYLGGCCVDCGSRQDLEFDHRDPGKKEFAITACASVSEDRFWVEVDKCELRCRDCHEWITILRRGELPARGRHGTISTYRYCKCGECREAARQYRRPTS